MESVATRYAKALLSLAIETSDIINYQASAKEINSVFNDNNELLEFLKSYCVKDEDKKSLLSKIFEGNIPVNLLYFLYLLIDKKRITYVKSILDEFNSLCNEERGILEGCVYSTKPLEQTELLKLEEKVSKDMNKKVLLSNKLDASLIGGIKIVVNDTVFDNSIISKMNSLKREIADGKDVD